MLVIHRDKGERLVLTLPDGRTIVVTNCGRDQLGIDAPRDIVIVRDELREEAAP